MTPCPYCAQTDTRKDRYGYCKKFQCFTISGKALELELLQKQLNSLYLIPKYKRNAFDGTAYYPRKEEKARLLHAVQKSIGFVPLNFLTL